MEVVYPELHSYFINNSILKLYKKSKNFENILNDLKKKFKHQLNESLKSGDILV